ncbi:MAG: crotonase/enoyl-CoA hydratase family protein [Actinomycetes bacterium]
MSEEQAVLTEQRDNVLIITINRPEARNAVNGAVAQGLADAVKHLDETDDLRVGILTGAGGAFCSGMDLKAFMKGELPFLAEEGFAGIAKKGPRKPLIAAIEGFAVAGGMEIALACDLIVAADGAKLGIPEAKRNLVAAGGALLRLPNRIPFHVAMELALTGDPISAQRAYELGLVNVVAPSGGAVDSALELAGRITVNGPLAVYASKEILTKAIDWTEAEGWDAQNEIVSPVFTSEDAQEGALAFAEKRDPVWKGR